MTVFSSLTNRIFFASAALTVLAIAVAVYRVNVAVTAQAEKELRRGLEEAGTQLEENRTTLFGHLAKEARLVADLSNLKAALGTSDPPTVQAIAEQYQVRIGSDLFVVTDPAGRVLAQAGRLRMTPADPATADAIHRATLGHEVVSLWPHSVGVVQVVTVPSLIGSELFGTVSLGFSLDAETAARFKALTNSEIAFAVGGRVQASTLPSRFNDALTSVVQRPRHSAARARRYRLRSHQPFAPAGAVVGRASSEQVLQTTAPMAIILRSRTDRLRFLNAVHRELAGTAVLAVLAATLVSYADRAHRDAAARRDHGDDARHGGDRRPDAADHAAPTRSGRMKTRVSWRRLSTP